MTHCPKCGGELILDRSSVSDAARFGYVGGRIHCLAGCTSLWMTRYVAMAPEREWATIRGHQPHEIRCKRCTNVILVRAPNALYCYPCSVERNRDRARASSQRRRVAA